MNNTPSINPVIRLFKFNKFVFNPKSFHIDNFFKEIDVDASSVSVEANRVTIECNINAFLLRSRVLYTPQDLFLLYVQKNKNDPKIFNVYAISINNIYGDCSAIGPTKPVISATPYKYKDIEIYTETIQTYFRDYIAKQNTTCKVYETLGEKNMRIMPGIVMPSIKNVYYTDRYTTVEWSDNVKTTVGCKEGEEFDKEIGLAMAISKRYFGNINYGQARSEFKYTVKHAHDMSKKVIASKARKKAKREQNKEV